MPDMQESENDEFSVQVEGVSQSTYTFYSLGLAFLVPINLSMKHFTIRKFKGSYNYMILPVDSGILEMLACTIIAIYYE